MILYPSVIAMRYTLAPTHFLKFSSAVLNLPNQYRSSSSDRSLVRGFHLFSSRLSDRASYIAQRRLYPLYARIMPLFPAVLIHWRVRSPLEVHHGIFPFQKKIFRRDRVNQSGSFGHDKAMKFINKFPKKLVFFRKQILLLLQCSDIKRGCVTRLCVRIFNIGMRRMFVIGDNKVCIDTTSSE